MEIKVTVTIKVNSMEEVKKVLEEIEVVWYKKS